MAKTPTYEELELRIQELEKVEYSLTQVKAALRISEERYRTSQAMGHVGNWEYSLQTSHFWGSPEAKRIYGFDPEQIEFSTDEVANCIPEMERVHQALVDLIEAGKPYNLEFEIHPKDSFEPKIISSIAELKQNEQGESLVVGVIQDITERKQAEEGLRESEERYRSLFDNIINGVAIYRAENDGEDFILVDFNKSGERIDNIEKEDVVGQSALKMFPGVKNFGLFDVFKRVWKTGKSERFPMASYKDGRISGWRDNYVYKLPSGEIVAVYSDESKRKAAEEEGAKLEAQLSNALEMAHLGHWEYDVANDLFTFNDHFYKIFRTTAKQIGGYTMSSAEYARRFIHPDDIAVVGEEIRKAIEATDPHFNRQLEHRIFYADGTVGYISVRFFIVKDAQGRTIKTYGVNQDITERKRAEETLMQSEERYRTILESIEENYFETDLGGRLTFISDYMTTSLRRPREQLIGMKNTDFMSPDSAKKIYHAFKQTYDTGKPIKKIDYEVILGDGSHRFHELSASLIRDPNGTPVGFRGVSRDITDHKRIEVAIRNREAFLNEMGNIARIGGWENDLVTGEATWTRETYNIVEMESGPILGFQEHLNYYPPKDRAVLEKAYRRAMETGERFDVEVQGKTAKGRLIWVRVIGRPEFKDGKCVKMKGILQDITDRKKLEAQLQQAQKLESIGTLAGGIAHEFNNILSIIIGNNELVMEELPQWSPARESAEEIRIAGLRASDVVKQLLVFSRQDDAQKRPVDIGSVVKESLKLIRSSIPTNIDIQLNGSEDILPISGNATQINQVLINLCSNAADAMLQTGGAIRIDLSNEMIDEGSENGISPLIPGSYVKLTVSDTGGGMDKETLERVFEPYFTTKEFGKGTGIGLSVVHGIVERHSGSISVESEIGKGTVFTILLPAYQGRIEQEPEEETALPRGNERVLFVDDEPIILKLGKQRLERLGYSVQGATDPLEALEMFRADPDAFDLVITDMAMPHMTGDQLVSEILKIRPGIPTMLCTGYSETISAEKAYKIGIRSFFMKPVDRTEFAVSVRKVLDEAKGPTQP